MRAQGRLARAFGVLVALTVGLIVLGALVRAHDAGLACPDWPLCFGSWIPPMDIRVAFEWTHRVVAGAITLAFVALALATLSPRGGGGAARVPLAIGAALLAVQIVLGGLTVLLQLAVWTVTAHLLVGNAFAATLWITRRRLLESAGLEDRTTAASGLRLAVFGIAAILVTQMTLGGLVSSNYAGLACPEWPTCNGGRWFPSWEGSVGLHLLHRWNGYLLLAAVLPVAAATRHDAHLARPLRIAALLALLQVVVGVLNVRLGIPVEVTGLHSALAAALVLSVAHACWIARPRSAPGDGLPS